MAFRSSELELTVEIQSAEDGVIVLGQLAPAVHASVTVQRDDASTIASAQTDALGRFRLELAEGGRIRLQVVREGEPAVVTSWIST